LTESQGSDLDKSLGSLRSEDLSKQVKERLEKGREGSLKRDEKKMCDEKEKNLENLVLPRLDRERKLRGKGITGKQSRQKGLRWPFGWAKRGNRDITILFYDRGLQEHRIKVYWISWADVEHEERVLKRVWKKDTRNGRRGRLLRVTGASEKKGG